MFQLIKKSLIVFLIPSFAFASVLCCCLEAASPEAETTQQISKHGPGKSHNTHCESHDTQADHTGEQHNCECPKLQGTLAKNFDILKSADIVHFFINHKILAVNSFFNSIPDLKLVFYDHSPPSNSDSLPLYLKYSVLRI